VYSATRRNASFIYMNGAISLFCAVGVGLVSKWYAGEIH